MNKNIKNIVLLSLFCFFPLYTHARNDIPASYMRNFARAGLAEKVKILEETSGEEFTGVLCDFALRFCLDSAGLLNNDPDMIALTRLAVKGVASAEEKNSAETLLKLCEISGDSGIRAEILDALAVTAQGNEAVIAGLNRLIADQNEAFAAGMKPDYQMLKAGMRALGNLGSSSSYPVLFAAYTLSYPKEITEIVRASLEHTGNYGDFLLYIVRNNPPTEKRQALKTGEEDENIELFVKNQLAQTALEAGLSADDEDSRELRYEAVRFLTDFRWNGAIKAVIQHFYQTQTDFVDGKADKSRFIEAITCLGAMENSEAAQVLAIQLGLFNVELEQKGSFNDFDKDIMIATVSALGNIGDKVAFDHLLYINFLPYPPEVRTSAKKALARLKW